MRTPTPTRTPEPVTQGTPAPDVAALEQAVADLRTDVDGLKATVAVLCAALGVEPRGPDSGR